MSKKRIRIIHETNPKKYFPALFLLSKRSEIIIVGAYRYSVLKEWLRAGIKDRSPLLNRSRNATLDLIFRFLLFTIRGETIVIGFAPWDWRLLVYRSLARHNRVIYHTSWHDWRRDHTPRQPYPLALRTRLRAIWLRFLTHSNVEIVAVTPLVAESVKKVTGQNAHIIPHAVPQVFYDAGVNRAPTPNEAKLRLLFVGEISSKKGVGVLTKILPNLVNFAELTVVGDGSMAKKLRHTSLEGMTYLGPIYDRDRLAKIMGEHDVLLVPSQRENGWEELFGIVIIEALAAGMAVLASDHVGPRTILKSASGAGLIDPDNHEELSEQIIELAQNRIHLRNLLEAQSSIAPNYKIDEIALAWKGLFKC